ncbi:hypothetical protein K3G39_13880 [Pontibacter sp. HSC-14F20]|uniref:hypothetical protein n=1 Tax=Pontibacter sp. HSC-14F20 TaxID=2864136 RepID=UPI001C732D51|nr:hypothetical protein [Pontibacter sp. HSC-14F20]MBX0334328.1 hypothetical protein [Pontibacter sp. HSC-14F20]
METTRDLNTEEPVLESKEIRYFQRIVLLENELKRLQAKGQPYLNEIGILQSELDEQKYLNGVLTKSKEELRKENLQLRLDNQKQKDIVEKLREKLAASNALRQAILVDMRQSSEWQQMNASLNRAREQMEAQRESINTLLSQLNKYRQL